MKLIQPNSLYRGQDESYKTSYDDNFFDSIEQTSIKNLLFQYMTERNETTKYDYTSNVQYGGKDQTYIDIKMVFKVPQQ